LRTGHRRDSRARSMNRGAPEGAGLDTNALTVALAAIAVLGLAGYVTAWTRSRFRTARASAAAVFVAAGAAAILGLSPVAVVPLLLASAAGFVLALGSESA
jgi:hypothetical protein